MNRRQFVGAAAAAAGAGFPGIAQEGAGGADGAVRPTSAGSPDRSLGAGNRVQLPPLEASTEPESKTPGPFLPLDRRFGYAIVGVGHLSINQILPGMMHSKYCRAAALVSGDRAKAEKMAAQYGIPGTSITDYANFERVAQMPGVDAVYIVLPNSMHREYVERAAKIGKHVLCEKPMATSAADCEAMIAACKQAKVKLMIAYRQQYDPLNRAVEKLIRSGRIGQLRSVVAGNSQAQGDPGQWRQKRALAGGGALPDVGVYCLNAARFLSGEEPVEMLGAVVQPKEDPRFREVESHCSFVARFPSGVVATCTTAYDVHRSSFIRLEGTEGWVEMNPAFGYKGNRVQWSHTDADRRNEVCEINVGEEDQFAQEMDHFAECVLRGREPRTPGEEGLQDQRLIEAIYRSAGSGKAVRVEPPSAPTRGPELTEQAA